MPDPAGDSFGRAVASLGPPLLAGLAAVEVAQRRLHPPQLPRLREGLAPLRRALDDALACYRAASAPPELRSFRDQLALAAERAAQALRLFGESPPETQAVPRVLAAMRLHALAQEALYPLRRALPPVSRFFLEPRVRARWREFEPEPAADPAAELTAEPTAEPTAQVGIHRAGGDDPDARGGFRLYVPETYDGRSALPLVVALHGGFGHGREFLWSWLREARSRRCLLLAPSSRGTTWPLQGPDLDAASLGSMVEFVTERWRVDRQRILLTGLSDGATYALLLGLREGSPFTALAPLSGVLHPANFHNGNLERARGRRIYLVHGALDWMFPVAVARMARDELAKAGADLVYREIPDLSHTLARDEHARILDWLPLAT